MDKRVFLAVSICAGIFLLWNQFYLKPYNEKQQQWAQQHQAQNPQATNPVQSSGGSTPGTIAQNNSSVPKATEAQSVELGDQNFATQISTKGGVVTSVRMADFRGQKTDKINRLIGGSEQLELQSPSAGWEYLSNVIYSVKSKAKDSLVLVFEDANVAIERSYRIDSATFSVEHQIGLKFKKQGPNYLYVGLRSLKNLHKDELENERRQIFFNRVGGQETWTVSDVEETTEHSGQGNWFGFTSRYFMSAIVNRSTELKPQFQARPFGAEEVAAGLFYPVKSAEMSIPVTMYYGPKDIDILKKVGNHLDSAVDFGWFTIFAYPMLTALKWFYQYVHNFGIAIILLTVLVKLLTYPLTLKSMKSMKQMQRIQPQLTRLREKYKDDKEKLNREMLQLMRSNGYNPMSGCLPIFIQMPIFIALYNVLYGAIDLFGQPFFGWIHDLSANDPYFVTPILLSLMMFVQQKMTPTTAADPAQQKMMMMMPVIFGFMMLWLPSGLTLYMLVNSVVSILQQLLINRSLATASNPA